MPSYSIPVVNSIEVSLHNPVPEGVKGPAALLHSVWSLDCQMANSCDLKSLKEQAVVELNSQFFHEFLRPCSLYVVFLILTELNAFLPSISPTVLSM